jgi:hypothetical protein
MKKNVVLLLVGAAACSGGEVRFAVDTLVAGDTTIVRTTGFPADDHVITLEEDWRVGGPDETAGYVFGRIGSFALTPDGGFVLYDAATPALQLFDAAGNYVRTLGGNGRGPGEYQDDIGVVVTSDGVVAQLDPTQARINRYRLDGEVLDAWPAPGAFWTGDALVADTAGRLMYQSVVGVPTADGMPPIGYVVLNRDGTVADTIMRPQVSPEMRPITVHHPQQLFVVSPYGNILRAEGSRYAVDVEHGGKVLRIERLIPAVAWQEGEREQIEATYNHLRSGAPMRGLPDQQNMVRRVRQWGDGTIWVATALPSEPIPDDELTASSGTPDFPIVTWRARSAHEVFSAEGSWLGRLVLPEGSELLAARSGRVWLAEYGPNGEPWLVRYRMTGGLAEGS